MIEPINTAADGTALTIKAQYYKNGLANIERGGSFGATGVLMIKRIDNAVHKTSNEGRTHSD